MENAIGTITIKFDPATYSLIETLLKRTETTTTTANVGVATTAPRATKAKTKKVEAAAVVDTDHEAGYEEDFSNEEETETTATTLTDVKAAFKTYAHSPKGGMDKAKAILKKYGYTALNEIKAKDFDKMLAALSK